MKKKVSVAEVVTTFLDVLGEQIESEQPEAVKRDELFRNCLREIETISGEKLTIMDGAILGCCINNVLVKHGYHREGAFFVRGTK